jgi:RHS repeat-associated protein
MAATVPSQGFSGETTKYYYDPLYQLNRVDYPNVAPLNGEIHQWTYDAIGNRLTSTVNSSTQTYTYQKIGANPLNWQRLTNDGQNAYTYDNNGSSVTRNGSGGNFTFGWNTYNRMVSISGAATANYTYDFQGRRGSKTAGTATTYLYDGLNLVREAGASSVDYLFGPGIDESLAMSRGGQVYYYETDALGSVAAHADSNGAVQNTYLYDAWGQTRSQTGLLGNSFTYTSREVGEAGLNFYRARYYQPSIGRFLSEDPAGLDTHLNLYSYVEGDPVFASDPLGLSKRRDRCETIARRLIGIFKSFDHHEEMGKGQKENCAQLEHELELFGKLNCGKIFGSIARQAGWYWAVYCKPREKLPETCPMPNPGTRPIPIIPELPGDEPCPGKCGCGCQPLPVPRPRPA